MFGGGFEGLEVVSCGIWLAENLEREEVVGEFWRMIDRRVSEDFAVVWSVFRAERAEGNGVCSAKWVVRYDDGAAVFRERLDGFWDTF